MNSLDTTKCPECEHDAFMELENNVVIGVHCENCGYSFDEDLGHLGHNHRAKEAYPDGWTCISCGDLYHGILPLIVEGTLCKPCYTKGEYL